MAYNSFLSWYQSQSNPEPQPENRAAAVPEKTEKRSYSLSDTRFWSNFSLGRTNLANVDVTQQTALGVPPFFGALLYITQGVAMLDRKVFGDADNGPVEKKNHPLWYFFAGRPHPDYSWFDFLCALLTNACLGNGYALIHWDYETMRPVYLEHIPSIYCYPEYDYNGRLWYVITGTLSGKTVIKRVPPTDIIHIKGLSLDGVLGYDITMLHNSALAAGIARQEYAASKMGIGIFPSIVVSTEEELQPHEVAIREENLIKRVGSAQKAGTPIYLDSGQSLQYYPPPTLDAALEQLSRLNAEDVCRITKVPRDLLALDTHGTYGAGVQRSKDFLLHCLNPWVEKIQEEFSAKLFYYSESRSRKAYFEFDTSMYTALDKEAEAEILAKLVAGTVMIPNEARARLGLPPEPGGDELMVNINLLPMSKAVEVALAKYLSSEGEKARGKQQGSSEKETPKPSQNGHENGKLVDTNAN